MPESSSAERVALAVATTSSQPHDGGDDAMMEMVAAAVAAPEGEEITITEQVCCYCFFRFFRHIFNI